MYSPESNVRKTGSYIYEEFMPTDGTDVKVCVMRLSVCISVCLSVSMHVCLSYASALCVCVLNLHVYVSSGVYGGA